MAETVLSSHFEDADWSRLSTPELIFLGEVVIDAGQKLQTTNSQIPTTATEEGSDAS